MTSLHTKAFAVAAFILSVPAVTLLAQVAVEPGFSVDLWTGYLFTWTAFGAVCAYIATALCAMLDAIATLRS